MIKVYVSNEKSFFKKKAYKVVKKKANIIIDDSFKYQENIGFGGALTEASAYVYSLMSKKNKSRFLNLLYGKNGLNYSWGRFSIGSCDFALSQYDYLESGKLTYEHDEKYFFPFLNDIEQVKKLNYIASPWSPPSIYKDNNSRIKGGKLKKDAYDAYASYLTSYCKMFVDKGFNLKAVTMQNEPEATQIWDSCLFTPEEEGEFAICYKKHLDMNGLSDIDLYIWDHNRDVILKRAEVTLAYKNVNEIVKGIAYHWYDNNCFSELTKVKERFKDKTLLFTEGCIELLLQKNGNNHYKNGLRYIENYIKDSENYSSGFIDWNVLLDEVGGPNHVGNYCEAPIMYHKKEKRLIINPSYYAIKHFSKYVKIGARRIKTTILVDKIIATTYQNIDKSIVTVLLNQGKSKKIRIEFNKKCIECCVSAFSIATIIMN